MSRIDRITVQTYRYTLDGLPGGKPERFIVTIDTDDGLSGSYAPHFGATPHAKAQVLEMARGLIGMDPEQRERVFERLKLSHRHYDKSGIASIDTALWDPYRDASSSAVAHKRLRGFIRTPLLIAEHIRGFEQKADFALAGGTDIMHIDPELDGGITGTMKLAHFCDAIGMEVQLHTAGPMHRHCMAAIANTHFYELGLVRPDNPTNPLQPPIYADDYGDGVGDVGEDGCVPVPAGPGLGVTYDVDRINSGEVDRVEIR